VSIKLTNSGTDFLVPPKEITYTQLKGIASSLTVGGEGAATYSFCMDRRDIIQLTLYNVLYVPDHPVRLLCPRHIAENTGIEMDSFNSI
jgi:hypothetical protein